MESKKKKKKNTTGARARGNKSSVSISGKRNRAFYGALFLIIVLAGRRKHVDITENERLFLGKTVRRQAIEWRIYYLIKNSCAHGREGNVQLDSQKLNLFAERIL